MRRLGRIGDAVRLYRRAVAAVPNDPEWRQVLREAERELQSAPELSAGTQAAIRAAAASAAAASRRVELGLGRARGRPA